MSAVPLPLAAPRVSVICAAYNGAAFLPETISRLAGQRLREFEAIIVDDGSTDATPGLLASIRDPRFVVATNERNRRLVHTRNRAASMARGAYVAVTDQDDLSHPERLERQARFLDTHPRASAVYSLVRLIDGEGRPRTGTIDWAYGGQQARAALLFHNFVTHSTLMFRRDRVVGDPYVPEYPLCEDYRLIVGLADQGDGLFPLHRRLVDYRWHGDNYTSSAFDEMAGFSRRLRAELLGRLGVAPTEAEMDLHDIFEAGPKDTLARTHRDCLAWLLHLRDANRRAGYVPVDAFDAVAADKWLEVSHKFCALGPPTWRTYARGPRARLAPRHWASLASLRVKCTLRGLRGAAPVAPS